VAIAADFDLAMAGGIASWAQSLRRGLEIARLKNDGRLVLWLPVGLAIGIAGYFALPIEPSVFGVGLLVLIAVACGSILIRGRSSPPAKLVLLAIAGFLAAKLQTTIAPGPSVSASTPSVGITGFVEKISAANNRSAKVLVRLESISGLGPSERPKKVQITAPLQKELRVGHFVEGEARLFPLLTPIMPGGFDYARSQWLEGIGAIGHARSPFRIRPDIHPPLWVKMKGSVETLRFVISERVHRAMPDELGLLAVALITGERAGLPQTMKNSLQASGLAHIVSISGLHMSLVAGGFFWMLRAAFALFPGLALTRPIKEWSALAALIVGAVYLMLSGSEVPTQRSYIMVAIMFAAMIAGRPALNLRNVATAAILVLLLDPKAVLQPGLQMSFLAVTGLLSFFEMWRSREPGSTRFGRRTSWTMFALRRLGIAIFTLAATTLIAGICTGPPAAFHFNRLSPYSLIGNLLALPVVSAIVMPMALVGTLLMPLGMEQVAFAVMGLGLKTVMAISDWTAGLPGARFVIPGHGPHSSLMMSAGILWICLVLGYARWFGLGLFALGLAMALLRSEPDVIIERTAANIAIRNELGQLVLANSRSRFAAERWLLADGDGAGSLVAAARPGFNCLRHTCTAIIKNKRLAYMDKQAEGKVECPDADILIAAFPLRGACKKIALRIDRFDVWREGAHALFVVDDGIRIVTVRQMRGQRPWVTSVTRRKDQAARDAQTQ
jgi:competence protein ComEC